MREEDTPGRKLIGVRSRTHVIEMYFIQPSEIVKFNEAR
jgi:hypothetical protein